MKNNRKGECYQTLAYNVEKPNKNKKDAPRVTKTSTNGDLRNGGKR